MNVNEFVQSPYLRGYDLAGKNVTVTIREMTVETVGAPGQQEQKPVLWFEGADRGLICNKPNLVAVARQYGPETDTWAGKRISLRPETVKAFGDTHLVIRVGTPANGK